MDISILQMGKLRLRDFFLNNLCVYVCAVVLIYYMFHTNRFNMDEVKIKIMFL